MLIKQTSLALLVLVLATSTGCSRHKKLPVHEQCANGIEQVSQLLNEKSKTYTKTERQRIQNLIKAAKIQQQHKRFNTCVDKMNRALILMKEDATSKQTKGTSN